MNKEKIVTENAPVAIGPYSQAIRAGGLVFFSGQIPLDPSTGQLVGGGIVPQTEQVLRNMLAMLEAAGLEPADVVKTTIYLADLGDFPVVNELYAELFVDPAPARATVGVAALPKGAAIEIEWIACAG
ncbi:MAG: reactive intermediate/imine deaminase [Desulfuromonas sp.]|nr:MAG: reactive intermediate/imine deaminase [Desulfuromonas sp.]